MIELLMGDQIWRLRNQIEKLRINPRESPREQKQQKINMNDRFPRSENNIQILYNKNYQRIYNAEKQLNKNRKLRKIINIINYYYQYQLVQTKLINLNKFSTE
ncbi:unnamed protein product [Paramecium octaurelia]|uniref:Uncharacterized protein n=1 Tax=Paramecium octaurelia TaxID=43137 RepID=A0A8S1YL69_PAROT|nr:unnamed protein product [Paramecium octaurelia]